MIPLIVELLFIPVLGTIFMQLEEQAAAQRNGERILMLATACSRDFNDFSRVLSGYTLTGAPFFKDRCQQLTRRLNDSINRLDELTKSSPVQAKEVTLLKGKMSTSLGLLNDILSYADKDNEAGSRKTDAFRQIHSVQESIESNLEIFIRAEQARSEENIKRAAALRRSLEVTGALAVMVQVAVVGMLVIGFSRGMARGLQLLAESTQKLARNEPLVLPVDGKDEIGHLSRVFKDMSDALVEANRKRQELIAIVSHDLRSPLTSLGAVFEGFKHGMYGHLNNQGENTVKNAEVTVSRLIALINDLLDVHKIETGSFDLTMADVDVGLLIKQAATTLEHFAGQKGLKLVASETCLHAHADADRLMQVLVNLISNAIKFSPAQSSITISAQAADKFVEISVTDQGRGIPPEHIASVFQKYEQVERSDVKNLRGSGIGLWICKAIVEQHGGTIGVESKVGSGSRFWFRVPASVAVATPSHPEQVIHQ